LRRNLESRAADETRRAMREQISQHLLDSTQFDLPEGVAARHAARVLQRRYIDLLQQGIPRERIEENLTELQAAAEQQAQRDLKLSFILGKVADAEKTEVSDDEVNARVAEMARQYNRRPERLRQELTNDGTLDQLQVALREEKALDKLLAEAEVTEVAAAEAAEGQQKPAGKKAASKPRAAKKAKKKSSKKEPKAG